MENSATAGQAAAEQKKAVLAGLICYLIWGGVPLVFQAIHRAGPSPWEIMAHRVVWGALAAAIYLLVARQTAELRRVLRDPRTLMWLALSAVLIATNWTLFVWAVNSGRTIESSLGYYITPLINMAAGALIFRERIGRIGQAAIALAAAGVTVQALALGHPPYVSLVLAVSFGCYGIVRKRAPVGAEAGLLIECLLLLPLALAYLGWLEGHGQGHFFSSPAATAWLIASGPITAVPLALFAWAARRMPLSSIGFLQFLAPTISFFIGVAEGERFTPVGAASFALIWAGALVFIYGAWRKTRGVRLARVASAG
jgi:chloramphenicol-sensitive protein RarD